MARWIGSVSAWQGVGLFAIALTISLVASLMLYWIVERPSHLLSRKVAKYLLQNQETRRNDGLATSQA